MKAGIYDPYLDTLGGGEKYCLTLAELLLKNDFEVDIFWDGENLKKKIEERLGLDIGKANFIPAPKGIIEKFITLRKYDLLFFMGDGSIPLMFGKKNILHVQVPFKRIGGNSLLNKIKLLMISEVVCNSYFTKNFIDKTFGISSKVIHPPINLENFKPEKKENLIISVARFSQLLQAKKQDILIKVFKRLCNNGLKGWRLVIAGGSDVGGKEFVSYLKKIVSGYPIKIEENIPFADLVNLYSKAKIFWSASGFDVDEESQPERVEHFGMTAVEAMSAGAVPFLLKKGGFKEIVEEGKSGYFWETESELEEKTTELIKDEGKIILIGNQAAKRSKIFSKENFIENVKRIVL
ncbi:MAG: D-inositol-3-phosphate glycosyltransferase [Microgenomates group bacterium ADurb.Bin219]|nr:MAG: D-inositol-3-phosphate glycosyltransferase [Microgenomates group bacterium ADurb.Bin219]